MCTPNIGFPYERVEQTSYITESLKHNLTDLQNNVFSDDEEKI